MSAATCGRGGRGRELARDHCRRVRRRGGRVGPLFVGERDDVSKLDHLSAEETACSALEEIGHLRRVSRLWRLRGALCHEPHRRWRLHRKPQRSGEGREHIELSSPLSWEWVRCSERSGAARGKKNFTARDSSKTSHPARAGGDPVLVPSLVCFFCFLAFQKSHTVTRH